MLGVFIRVIWAAEFIFGIILKIWPTFALFRAHLGVFLGSKNSKLPDPHNTRELGV